MAALPSLVWITPDNYLYSDTDGGGFEYFQLSTADLNYLKNNNYDNQGRIEVLWTWTETTGPLIGASLPSDAVELTADSDAWAQIQAGTFVIGEIPLSSQEISFKYGSQSDYNSLDLKDQGALYIITDSSAGKIYKGNTLIASYDQEYQANNDSNNILVNIGASKIYASFASSMISNLENKWGVIGVI